MRKTPFSPLLHRLPRSKMQAAQIPPARKKAVGGIFADKHLFFSPSDVASEDMVIATKKVFQKFFGNETLCFSR